MTEKKTPKATTKASAEKDHEKRLSEEELLADLPALRAPERLRLRHKNSILAIGFRFRDRLDQLGIETDDDGNAAISTEQALLMMDLAAEVDEFAESIAENPAEYERWAEENSNDPEKFIAIMNRYTGAVGE